MEGVSPDGDIKDTREWFDTNGDDIVLYIDQEDTDYCEVIIGSAKPNVATLNEFLRK